MSFHYTFTNLIFYLFSFLQLSGIYKLPNCILYYALSFFFFCLSAVTMTKRLATLFRNPSNFRLQSIRKKKGRNMVKCHINGDVQIANITVVFGQLPTKHSYTFFTDQKIGRNFFFLVGISHIPFVSFFSTYCHQIQHLKTNKNKL